MLRGEAVSALRALRLLARCALALAGSVAAFNAGAAITCSVMVTSITSVYDPNVATDNVMTGSYTISCTRLAGDPNSLNWSLGADNGLQPGGGNNRVDGPGGRYSYDLYRLAPYTNAANKWQDTGTTRFTGTMNFGAGLTATQSGAFDLVVYGSQTVRAAGTYTDTIIVTLRNTSTGTTLNTGVISVSVITTNACQIAVPPGNINLNYTSFQAAAAATSTSFGVRCTTALPYTMALDATSGTVLGLTYTLSLSQSSGTGIGATQSYSINGSMAAAQVGTCATASCSASQTRTLTITY
jgi:spore coat protein U-like protein